MTSTVATVSRARRWRGFAGWAVFIRELAGMGSRIGTYVVRVIFIGGIFLLMYLAAFDELQYTSMPIGRLAEVGRRLFETFAWSQFVIATLLTPVLVAGAIVDEKQRRTLDLLLASDTGAFRIVTEKLLARVLQLVLLLLAAVPVLAMVQLFGGVSYGDIVKVFLVTLGSVVQAAGLALLFSTVFRKTYTAVIATVLTLALVCFWGLCASGWELFWFVPVLGLWGILYKAFGIAWYWYALGGALCGIFFMLVSAALLRRAANWSAAAVLSRWHGRLNRFYEGVNVTGVHVPVFRRKPVGGNPIAWYELHGKVAGRSLYLLRMSLLLLVGLAVLELPILSAGALSDTGVQQVFVGALFMLVMLVVGVLASSAINSEPNQATIELLRLPGVRFGELVRGKALGVLKRTAPFLVVFAAHMMLVAYFATLPPAWALLALEFAVFTWFFICIGLYFSFRFSKTRTSVTLMLLVLIAMNGLPLVWSEFTGASLALWVSPLFWATATVKGASWSDYPLPIPGEWDSSFTWVTFGTFLVQLVAVMLVFLVVSVFVYRRLSRRETWSPGKE